MEKVTEELRKHYYYAFKKYGPCSKGVDWGKDKDVILRYKNMLAVILTDETKINEPYSLLDVGCGYGGLYNYCIDNNIEILYTGIDVCLNMIEYAKSRYYDVSFFCEDIFNFNPDKKFDFIVCNGILTQKLETSFFEMDKFAKNLIKKMFSLCKKGIAFNIMSTYVNYFSSNLYYKHPAEMLIYCLSEISQKVKIDHSYGIYEYTLYIYK